MNTIQNNIVALGDKIGRLQAAKGAQPYLGLPPGPSNTCAADWAAWDARQKAHHEWEKDTPAQARARAKAKGLMAQARPHPVAHAASVGLAEWR